MGLAFARVGIGMHGVSVMHRFALLSLALFSLSLSACVQRGVVWEVDSWDRTVKIDQQVYQVSPDTELYAANGRRISLAALPAYGTNGIGVRNLSRAEVDFRANDAFGEHNLEQLWVRRP